MAKYIQTREVTVPEDRQRRDINEKKLGELADSIRELGLGHAIVLADDGRTLVAGYRRLTAIKDIYEHFENIMEHWLKYDGEVIPWGQIPFTVVSDLTEDQIFELELDENIKREDLSWQDRSTAIARLHALRKSKDPAHTLTATAVEIAGEALPNSGSPVAEVSDAVFVQQYMDDPEVKAASSLKEAKQVVSKKLEKQFREALARTINAKALQSSHQLIHGDCVEVVSKLDANQFHCVVTDPPYGIDADQFGTQSSVGHDYDDGIEKMFELHTVLAPQLYRVMAVSSHLYMFCDPELFAKLKIIYQYHGFDIWRTPLIWDKSPVGMLPSPQGGPRRCYESIMFARKGNLNVTAVYSDVLRYPPVTVKEHGAQKPVDVYIDLLRRSCIPGYSILDCFCGTGTIFPAANKLRLKATGVEKSAATYTIAAQTLKGAA